MLARSTRRVVPFIAAAFLLVVGALFLSFTSKHFSSFRISSHGSQYQDGGFDASISHTELFSVSTSNREHFMIDFGELKALNPNIIPHPVLEDTYIVAAQQLPSTVKNSVWNAEISCNAQFRGGKLVCITLPMNLPISATYGDKCVGDHGYYAFNIGPHDARIFYGPKNPYAIYGSNSIYACFGLFVQDFRSLVDWGLEDLDDHEFRRPTELQRPGEYGEFEKNWFAFWDAKGDIYLHHDIAPRRTFAQLAWDGSVGPDLAPLARANDEKCMLRYMPKIGPELESIHQATNSLSVTMCSRSDPSCMVTDSNTFIMTIYQHKQYFAYHSVYEPYVMLFGRSSPFAVHGMSTKPLWIHGRGKPGATKPTYLSTEHAKTWNQTEMFYVTSISWKGHGMKYHGYIDDVMFLGFGIEDERTGGIDVLASDVLKDIGFCDSE